MGSGKLYWRCVLKTTLGWVLRNINFDWIRILILKYRNKRKSKAFGWPKIKHSSETLNVNKTDNWNWARSKGSLHDTPSYLLVQIKMFRFNIAPLSSFKQILYWLGSCAKSYGNSFLFVSKTFKLQNWKHE